MMLSSGLSAIIEHPDVWTQNKKMDVSRQKVSNWYSYENGNIAASRGYLELIKERQTYLKFRKNSMNYAAKSGHLNVVKWLHFDRNEVLQKMR